MLFRFPDSKQLNVKTLISHIVIFRWSVRYFSEIHDDIVNCSNFKMPKEEMAELLCISQATNLGRTDSFNCSLRKMQVAKQLKLGTLLPVLIFCIVLIESSYFI